MKTFSKLPRFIGWSFFILWIGWNIHWLRQGELAPSVLIHYFGIPAPSTGMTRSVLAMLEGEWRTSLMWNAFTLPLCALYLGSALWLAKCLLRKDALLLPKWLAGAWLVVLVSAQISKWVLGSAWW